METSYIVERLCELASLLVEGTINIAEMTALREMYIKLLESVRPAGTHIIDTDHLINEVRVMHNYGLNLIGCIRFVRVASPDPALRGLREARDFVRDVCGVSNHQIDGDCRCCATR